MNNNFLLPELPSIDEPHIKKDALEMEVYNSIERYFPLAEDLENMLPAQRRKRQLAAEVCAICFSLAGDFLMSQDESVLDDYNFI